MGVPKAVGKWLHLGLTLLLAGILLTIGVVVAIGKVEIRSAGQVHDEPPQDRDTSQPADARIEHVAGADELFAALGQTAYCLKYEGALIDCWIEVDIDGKQTRLGGHVGEQFRAAVRASTDGQTTVGEPSGYLVWVRREENGKEAWDLAVSLLDKEGRQISSASTHGISPPQPSANSGSADSGGAFRGSLSDGQEATLATFMTFGEQEGQVTRTARLKCKAVK